MKKNNHPLTIIFILLIGNSSAFTISYLQCVPTQCPKHNCCDSSDNCADTEDTCTRFEDNDPDEEVLKYQRCFKEKCFYQCCIQKKCGTKEECSSLAQKASVFLLVASFMCCFLCLGMYYVAYKAARNR